MPESNFRRIGGKYHIEEGQLRNKRGEPLSEDEPLFLLRARDIYAYDLLRIYYSWCAPDARAATSPHLYGIATAVEAFKEFAAKHPDRMKKPD